jgi:hypothetical protein
MSLALLVVGCAPSIPGPTANPTIAASPSGAIVETPGTSAAPSASTATAATAATPVPSPRASSPECVVPEQNGLLPSDRLVGLAVSSTTTHDLVTFSFATQAAPGPAGSPRGTLSVAQPPFSYAGSGQPIDVLGQHAVQVRFTGMTLSSDTGQATYTGPAEVKPNLPALREAIQYDAFEGVVGWYIGWDGPGCVTLTRNGNEVTVMIGHPEAPAG